MITFGIVFFIILSFIIIAILPLIIISPIILLFGARIFHSIMTGDTSKIKSPITNTTKVCKLLSNEYIRFMNVVEYRDPFKILKDLANIFN